MSSEATGFVVDAEKGYILTNRHVVCAGPFWGYCIFDNHEEVRDYMSARILHTNTNHSAMFSLFTVIQYMILASYDSIRKLSNICLWPL